MDSLTSPDTDEYIKVLCVPDQGLLLGFTVTQEICPKLCFVPF